MAKYGHVSNWDDRRFFLAVARAASVRKAATKLGTSRSTVLRRIAALERDLGVRLFERMPNGYFVTPAGEELQGAVERMEAEADAADRRVAGRDGEPGGTVRVSLPGALATCVLMPEFAAFSRSHPNIRLEILATYDMPDMARREADVAIRISNDPPADLVGRRLLKVARASYVGAAYVSRAEAGETVPPLTWIGWSLDSSSSLQWIDDSDHPDVPVGSIITDPYATVAAVGAGMGMSILPCFMGDTAPGLYRMPPGNRHNEMCLWILTHEDLRNTARIRIVTGFLADALLRHRDLLEGNREGPSAVEGDPPLT